MEHKPAQEPDTDPGTVSCRIVENDTVSDKKTTIQLFTSTTKRLTYRKRGNDTYDDVINRDLDTLKCPSLKVIEEEELKRVHTHG
jgi:hypothetical protein